MANEFIGQEFLIERCISIIETENTYSILLRGHWGSGKTTLAKELPCMTLFINTHTFQVAPVKTIFNPARHRADVHIVDEAHRIGDFEAFYEWMARYNFLFTTNLASRIPEPFLSRCFVFRLDDYTLTELSKIVQVHVGWNSSICEMVAERARGVPRVAVNLSLKIKYLLNRRGVTPTKRTILGVFEEMQIDQSGLTHLDRALLNALRTGPKSARNLQAIIGVDEDELRRMERFLLNQELITVTNKGRELVGQEV